MEQVQLSISPAQMTKIRKGASKRLSMEQWAKARIYAFLFKSIFQNMRYKKHDMDLFEELKKKKII